MRRILLIDDDSGIQKVWQRFHDVTDRVFRAEFSLETANDLQQAEAMIAEKEYDAIIVDLTIPPNNSAFTESWIAERSEALPPLIVLTGDDDIYTRRRCMMLGASDFWLKDDAQERPDLFFKSLYNKYLSRYASNRTRSAA